MKMPELAIPFTLCRGSCMIDAWKAAVDPTQLQTDSNNDANSLEGNSTVVEPATSGTQPDGSSSLSSSSPAQPPTTPKQGGRRLWQRINVYVLLFVLLVIIAVGVVAGYVIKDKKSNTPKSSSSSSQALSESALQQLANTDVSVGTSSQTLNVASNAVFAGSVLIRSNLDIAGAVAIGGNLTLPGITVSGASQLGQVNATGIAVSGVETVQGVLTAKDGLNVTGNSTFSGSVSAAALITSNLTISGDLNLTHHVTAGGAIPSLAKGTAVGGGGSASVSGSDTSGTVIINTGSSPPAGCFATVTFSSAFAATPHVVVTPIGSGAAGLQYYVNRSTTNFSICALNAAGSSQTFGFDYIVLD